MRMLMICALLLTGCATADPVASQTTVREISERSYRIGEPQTTIVGDVLIRVRHYFVEDAGVTSVQANKDFRVRGGGFDIPFEEGQNLEVAGSRTIDGARYFLVPVEASQLGIGGVVSLQVDEDGRIYKKILDGGAIFTFRADPIDGRLIPVEQTAALKSRPFENYEIVFNGSDGQAMRFTYREYSPDDLARTAFFQDLSYPISARTIRFRKLQLDVLGLDDGSITFSVRSD
jgi:hypothetical protein